MSSYPGLSCVRGAESCIFTMPYQSIYCLLSIRVQLAGRDGFPQITSDTLWGGGPFKTPSPLVRTRFLVFFFPLPLSCLFIQLIHFPGSLPSPSSHGECFMFSMTTCPLSPSSNICLWYREEIEKRLLANCREWWWGSDRVWMSSLCISTTAHFTLEMVTCCCFTQKVHVLF